MQEATVTKKKDGFRILLNERTEPCAKDNLCRHTTTRVMCATHNTHLHTKNGTLSFLFCSGFIK